VIFGKLFAKLGFTPVPGADGSLQLFHQSLAEAISWGRSRVDTAAPQSCLRGAPFDSRTTETIDAEFVSGVIDWRHKHVGAVAADSTLHGGRLLAYFPDANLCDGAAEVESQGFFDLDNCPPWQTWVALFNDGAEDGRGYRRYLVAWVPPQFLSLTTAGIDVNPEECIVWLDSTGLPLAKRLER
jgi:hypothetical protein